MEIWLAIHGINPEPWTAPEFSVGRKNGKSFPRAYKSPGLSAYQDAIREELEYSHPDLEKLTGKVQLELFLWRQLPVYEGERGSVRKHEADATNMQKALEDALQGYLFANDRDVADIHTVVVEQEHDTEPFILIRATNVFSIPEIAAKKAKEMKLLQASRRHPSAQNNTRLPNPSAPVDDLF